MTNKALVSIFNTLKSDTIFFGPQGFVVANTELKLEKAQLGFGKDDTGADLSGDNAGDWQAFWCVIARDTELGDPYFVDTSKNEQPVYTAFLGDLGWEVELVSASLIGFVTCLNLLHSHGEQSEAQFVPDENAIVDDATLAKLLELLSKSSENQSYWKMFFRCYQDWLQEE